MMAYHQQGSLIADPREWVARAIRHGRMPGDEVDQFADLTSIIWNSPLNRLPMSRMASGHFQFNGMDEGYQGFSIL